LEGNGHEQPDKLKNQLHCTDYAGGHNPILGGCYAKQVRNRSHRNNRFGYACGGSGLAHLVYGAKMTDAINSGGGTGCIEGLGRG